MAATVAVQDAIDRSAYRIVARYHPTFGYLIARDQHDVFALARPVLAGINHPRLRCYWGGRSLG